jgi:hypothetical protein
VRPKAAMRGAGRPAWSGENALKTVFPTLAEAVVAKRLAQRFVFGGQVREDVLKCTIAPGFGRKGDPNSPSFSLAYPPLPFFFPSSPFQPAARGPKGAVALSRWPTIGYFFTLLLTMISHSPSTGTVSGARQGTVHLSAIGVLHYIVERKLLMVLPRA